MDYTTIVGAALVGLYIIYTISMAHMVGKANKKEITKL